MSGPRVWAPRAKTLEFDADGRKVSAVEDARRPGWFEPADVIEADSDYWVVVDGERVPDPLARWAPYGVHGARRVLDVTAFHWTDQAWRGAGLDNRSVLYELHVGTFTPEGTLTAAAARLDQLVRLGITHVELMPLAAFDGDRGWGYDGVLLNAVHEAYGGPSALAAFVDAAHARGIGVLLDVVHNHLGPSGNYWETFAPFFTDRHHTPWGSAVNLDAPGSDDVREILIDCCLSWLRDFHLDGLRLDAVHELHDSRATTYLEQLAERVAALAVEVGRPLALVAESDRNDPRTVVPLRDGGIGMTAQWDDDVHHALHWLMTGEGFAYYADFASCAAAASALERGFLHDGRWSSFRGRSHGRRIDFARTPARRFVVSLQTHDQVGNRARGDRLSILVPLDRAAAGAAILLSLPYVPMLFMGEEWAAQTPWQFFTSFTDPELGAAVSAGRRSEFGGHGWGDDDVPDPQEESTYRNSVLDWDESSRPPGSRMVEWYAALIALRRSVVTELPVCRWAPGADGRPRWWSVAVGSRLTLANLGSSPVHLVLEQCCDDPRVLASWRARDMDPVTPGRALRLDVGQSLVLDGYRLDGERAS